MYVRLGLRVLNIINFLMQLITELLIFNLSEMKLENFWRIFYGCIWTPRHDFYFEGFTSIPTVPKPA